MATLQPPTPKGDGGRIPKEPSHPPAATAGSSDLVVACIPGTGSALILMTAGSRLEGQVSVSEIVMRLDG
jgi:hypothetical protein